MVYFVVMKMFAQCCVWNAEHPASSHVTCSRPHIAACQLQVRRAVALHTGGQVHGNVLSPTQKSWRKRLGFVPVPLTLTRVTRTTRADLQTAVCTPQAQPTRARVRSLTC